VTAWTIFNAEFRTFRGDLLRVPHKAGTRYRDVFTSQEIRPRVEKGQAILAVTVGPRDVGCVVAEMR
jgi:gamma-glutamyl hercynylcysteine S-oxide synthase